MMDLHKVARMKTKSLRRKFIKACCNPERMSECLLAVMLNRLMSSAMSSVTVSAVGRRTRGGRVLSEPVKRERVVLREVIVGSLMTISCV